MGRLAILRGKAKETKKAADQKAMAAPAAMDDASIALKTSVIPLGLTKEDVAKNLDIVATGVASRTGVARQQPSRRAARPEQAKLAPGQLRDR